MQDKYGQLRLSMAKVLKEKRTKSISKICNEVGISKSILSDLERGNKEIFFSTFWRIAEALDVSPSELVRNIEENLPEHFSFIED